MLSYTKRELRERFSCDSCVFIDTYHKKHFGCLLNVGIEDNSLSRKKFTFCNRHIAKKAIKVKCKKTKFQKRIYMKKNVLRKSFPFKPAQII